MYQSNNAWFALKRFAATVAAVAVFTVTANAAPAISGVAGSPTNGQVITIKGSGFGSKSPAAPLWYFPFGDGTRGTHPTLSRKQFTGSIFGDLSTRSEKAPGSTNVLSYSYNNPDSVAMGPGSVSLNGSDVAYVFWKTMFNMPRRGGPDTFNYKLMRIFSQGHKQNLYSGDGVIIPEYTAINEYTGCADCFDYSLQGQQWQEDKWLTDEIVYKTGTVDNHDGIFWFYRNGFKTNKRTYRMRTSELPEKYDSITFAHFYRGLIGSDAGFMDILYVDDSWAHVIVSDKATLNETTNYAREVQIPTTWSDGQVQVSFRRGALPAGSKLYLYVYAPDGSVNSNGFPVDCATCKTPTPPGGVTAK
jgi:hypothetical protein